jgi:hypothetical protein
MPPRGQAGQAPFGVRRLHSYPSSGFSSPSPRSPIKNLWHERRLNMRRRPRRSFDTIASSQAFAKQALPRPLRLHGTECHRRREDGPLSAQDTAMVIDRPAVRASDRDAARCSRRSWRRSALRRVRSLIVGDARSGSNLSPMPPSLGRSRVAPCALGTGRVVLMAAPDHVLAHRGRPSRGTASSLPRQTSRSNFKRFPARAPRASPTYARN